MMFPRAANCGEVVVVSVGGTVGWGWSGGSSWSSSWGRWTRGMGWGSNSCGRAGSTCWCGGWGGSARYTAIVSYFAGAKSIASILVFCCGTSTRVAGTTFVVTSVEFVRVDTSANGVS